MKQIITCLFLALGLQMMAQKEPSITVKTDTTNIKIGEQLTFSISTPNQEKVIFPKLNLQGLEVAEDLPVDTLTNNLVKKYLITGFDSGAFYIKQQQVFIDAKAYFTDSLLVNVATVQVDTTKLAPYYTVKDFEKESYTLAELWYRSQTYVYIALGIVAFLLALYFLFRKKKEEKRVVVPKIPPYIAAKKELEELENKELWQNNKIKEYYSELTDIVRKYIGDELMVQAMEITTDELMLLLTSENKQRSLGLDKEVLLRLKTFLSQADFVKFAKQKPLDSDIKGHQSDAELVINTIHEIVESKKTEEKDEVQ
ncbi:LPXTG cell wall anchor domain-containing protein [Wenyingzhuangia sp. 1_MG-2023]|nr:LPXTG cell wall anchor domain-containing protein [Wenyingzhuangia sp. 1_MG-2023]